VTGLVHIFGKAIMINHNRVYTIILAALAVYLAIPAAGMILFLASPTHPSTVDLGIHLPDWSIPLVLAAHILYLGGILLTLLARRVRPECGRWLSRMLNWALIPALPGGPLIGIYGLCKVDKQAPPAQST
jgi:hypothetical protein